MNGGLFVGALVTGFLGSAHCLGMCGTLVTALSLADSRGAVLLFHLLYNAGRIGTYTVLGFLAGWLGLGAVRGEGLLGVGRYLLMGADVFVILAGVGTAGALGRLNVMKLEFAALLGAITAAAAKLRGLPTSLAALPLGAVMGLLPCGFLYAVLLNAGLSSKPSDAAWTMAGFGLGTAPALLTFGSAAHLLGARTRSWMVRGAGAAVALMGVYNLFRHWTGACCL